MSDAPRPLPAAGARHMLRVLTPDRRRTLVTFGAAVLVFVVGAFLHKGFASAGSVKAILVVASFVGIVAAGQTFVIFVGGIDLSVPWVLNAAGILFATTSLGGIPAPPTPCWLRWRWVPRSVPSTASASRTSPCPRW